jgi:hypothetical protein
VILVSVVIVVSVVSACIIPPLNFRSWLKVSYSCSLARNWASLSFNYSDSAKSSSPTNRVLLVCKPTTPNGYLL